MTRKLFSFAIRCCLVAIMVLEVYGFVPNAFGQWSAPKNPQPIEILRSGKIDAASGRLADAHSKFLWFFENATEIDSAHSAVNRSFLLKYWNDLAKDYEPAREQLHKMFEQSKLSCISDERTVDDFMSFNAIALELGRRKDVVEVFLKVAEIDSAFGLEIYEIAQSSLVDEKRFRICAKYLSAERARILATEKFRETANVSKNPISQNAAIRVFSKSIEEILCILCGTQQLENAQEILELSQKDVPGLVIRSEMLRRIYQKKAANK